MNQLKQIIIKEEKFYYSLSFDIDDFIGDGIWWLQIYDVDLNCIIDRPFASSLFVFTDDDVRKKVKIIVLNEILNPKGIAI